MIFLRCRFSEVLDLKNVGDANLLKKGHITLVSRAHDRHIQSIVNENNFVHRSGVGSI